MGLSTGHLQGMRHRASRGAVDTPRWLQTSTTRWLHVCLSSCNNRSLWNLGAHFAITIWGLKRNFESWAEVTKPRSIRYCPQFRPPPPQRKKVILVTSNSGQMKKSRRTDGLFWGETKSPGKENFPSRKMFPDRKSIFISSVHKSVERKIL